MTLYLIDINVWLAMTWARHPQHAVTAQWYSRVDNSAMLFCRLTMLGFLRLLTNEKVMGDSTETVSGALKLYDRWMRDPRVALMPEPASMDPVFRQALSVLGTQPATKGIADCYLVGFAEAAGAHLVTLDRGLAATAQVRGVGITLLGG